jgi:hypothetical protein
MALLSKFLDLALPTKSLWRNLDTIGAKNTVESDVGFAPNQLNLFFTTLQSTITISTRVADHPRQANSREFSFSNTYELEVFNAILEIKSNAVGMDGVPINFLKMMLAYVLTFITHILNTDNI